MPQLLVRNLEARVVKKLRLKAARDGVSVEEEHRRILREALGGTSRPGKRASSPAPKRKKSFKESLLGLAEALDGRNLLRRADDMPRDIEL
jgi:plasmid stability protein